ncbi:MAG TPA: pyridoxamine kinase [Clostridiales bacterium]|nr:pyridoxamine kinase [Clostridiales bacterium]HBJ97767.1 pyridoxamine kinase [Clostridiales bacterium]
MNTKRILTVQDLSCVGQCSLTVALPVISALGIETAVLPTSILSNHTMFSGFTKFDLDAQIDDIIEMWKKQNFSFDALYTGYVGNSYLVNKINGLKKSLSSGRIYVDPAMADHGKLYPGFDKEYVKAMKALCYDATVILPNISEACLLLDIDYKPFNEEEIKTLAKKLSDTFNASVILKGVEGKGKTGVCVYNLDEKTCEVYVHEKISTSYHGTGDIYASVFVALVEKGYSYFESAKISADFVVNCIISTISDKEHFYGVHFEKELSNLIKRLETDKG